jgi:hypothetical protein
MNDEQKARFDAILNDMFGKAEKPDPLDFKGGDLLPWQVLSLGFVALTEKVALLEAQVNALELVVADICEQLQLGSIDDTFEPVKMSETD